MAFLRVETRPFLRRHLLLISFLALIGIAPCLNAQLPDSVHITPVPKPDRESRTEVAVPDPGSGSSHVRPMRVDVDLVLVPVTVTDFLNHSITDLPKNSFQLFENDEPQQIEYFSTEDGPISVGLLLDLSRSMTNKFDTEREAVRSFVDNANPQDDYFVITFADRPRLATSSTQSLDDIQSSLALVKPEGNTALLDAVYLAVARMRSARYKRRALLIITDGGDNHSRYRMREIRSLVEEADVQVYALGIFDNFFHSFEEFMGKRWLSEITDVTGGRTVTADNISKVPELAAAISREMRSQYVLGYKPRDLTRDGRWRRLKVRVSPPKPNVRLQVYSKKGYNAPKP